MGFHQPEPPIGFLQASLTSEKTWSGANGSATRGRALFAGALGPLMRGDNYLISGWGMKLIPHVPFYQTCVWGGDRTHYHVAASRHGRPNEGMPRGSWGLFSSFSFMSSAPHNLCIWNPNLTLGESLSLSKCPLRFGILLISFVLHLRKVNKRPH